MSLFNETDVDLEAATDQLVDEICQRLATLYTLVDMTMSATGPPVEEIRTQATAVVRRLAGPDARSAAAAVVRTLWPPQPGSHVPAPWSSTPLGVLIRRACEA